MSDYYKDQRISAVWGGDVDFEENCMNHITRDVTARLMNLGAFAYWL